MLTSLTYSSQGTVISKGAVLFIIFTYLLSCFSIFSMQSQEQQRPCSTWINQVLLTFVFPGRRIPSKNSWLNTTLIKTLVMMTPTRYSCLIVPSWCSVCHLLNVNWLTVCQLYLSIKLIARQNIISLFLSTFCPPAVRHSSCSVTF